MKLLRIPLALVLIVALTSIVGTVESRADIDIRLSVKFIRNTDGAYPAGGAGTIGTNSTFQVEVDLGNAVLSATGRGYKLQVVEYLGIQPPPPTGQPANFWFTNDARSSVRAMEAASIADPTGWRRNNNGAVNIYVNNSSSGQCSFNGNGDSISLGTSIVRGTVLHELGHFFNLSHTHAGDTVCTNPPPYMLGDGDGLSETVPDHNCYTTREALMAALPPSLRAAVDTSWLNVMSYHESDQLLDVQMDYWTDTANRGRLAVCSGKTFFIIPGGFDVFADGLSPGQGFRTVARGLLGVTVPDDILLLRAGTYSAPTRITTPCTLRATRGVVTLTR